MLVRNCFLDLGNIEAPACSYVWIMQSQVNCDRKRICAVNRPCFKCHSTIVKKPGETKFSFQSKLDEIPTNNVKPADVLFCFVQRIRVCATYLQKRKFKIDPAGQSNCHKHYMPHRNTHFVHSDGSHLAVEPTDFQ